MTKKVAIIDYGFGNIKSVVNAIVFCEAQPVIISKTDELKNYGGAILPGVGAFAPAAEFLRKSNFDKAISDYVLSGKMLYGTCLGFQLLFTKSYENGEHNGLDLISGEVSRFEFNDKNLKIPHMGWNTIEITDNSNAKKMFDGISNNENFYFVHSYYACLKNVLQAASWTEYGIKFCSTIAMDNVWGSQFHPEKSETMGLKLMSNFIKAIK
jgi:glutamine amidotransferase